VVSGERICHLDRPKRGRGPAPPVVQPRQRRGLRA